MVVGEGFEPSKLSQQIYSLPPLTARESHRKESGIIISDTVGVKPWETFFLQLLAK